MYKKSHNDDVIIRISDGAQIPKDDRNSDYQEFKEWKKAGNTIQPADPKPELPSGDKDKLRRSDPGDVVEAVVKALNKKGVDISVKEVANELAVKAAGEDNK